ncbi:DUF3305 domain-containing protein [Hydrogenophaga sp. OTU3427]|uniref:DUF3305 domain-containing protein n=1 Tax=Hydrogenophaga sp. OTU3427 TaxID=3043856 RepID=UPI00313D87C4
MTDRPRLTVAVVMRREAVSGPQARWLPWRWVLADVVAQAELGLPDDVTEAQRIEDTQAQSAEGAQHWVFPGLPLELFRDDAEGLFLNLSTERPAVWVMWRPDESGAPEALPAPQIVTLSYTDAGRWLDAQERVDQVPAPAAMVEWLRAFVAEHYQPEAKRRKRPESFRPLTDRFGNPASISTTKQRGGGGGHG